MSRDDNFTGNFHLYLNDNVRVGGCDCELLLSLLLLLHMAVLFENAMLLAGSFYVLYFFGWIRLIHDRESTMRIRIGIGISK